MSDPSRDCANCEAYVKRLGRRARRCDCCEHFQPVRLDRPSGMLLCDACATNIREHRLLERLRKSDGPRRTPHHAD